MYLPELSLSTLVMVMARSFNIMMATPILLDAPWENTIPSSSSNLFQCLSPKPLELRVKIFISAILDKVKYFLQMGKSVLLNRLKILGIHIYCCLVDKEAIYT